MPYSLKGNSVVKSDSGEVVKTHPTRERALAHLRALKANVREGSPAVLGALLEGAFDEARHPRDPRGRWTVGDHVTFQHGYFGRVPARVTKVTSTRVHITSPDPRVWDTSMTANQAAVRLENMIGPHAVRPRLAKGQTANELRGGIPRALPTSRRATLGRAEGDAAARTRAEILAKSPGAAADLARHQSIASGSARAAREAQIAGAKRNQRLAARARLTGKMSEADALGALLDGA